MSGSAAALEPAGTPVLGPSALGGDPRRFLYLTWLLAVTEWRLRFFGSVLGYLWQLFRPLLLFGVLLVVFTKFVPVGNQTPHHPQVLLTSIVLFLFFSEATAGAVSSVVDRENLVRKIQFPRLAIPLSVVLTSCFNFAVNFLAVLIFVLAAGIEPRWSWLEVPLIFAVLSAFAAGVAMILSALFVRYRDVRPIWEVVLQALWYASPVIYSIELLGDRHLAGIPLQHAVMMNPIACAIEQARRALVDPGAPTLATAAGAGWHLLIPAGVVLGAVGLGFWLFNREAPRVAEDL